MLVVAAIDEVDYGIKSGGVLVKPAVVVEGVGVGLAGGEDFVGALDHAGEIVGLVDADLKFVAVADVALREGEACAAAGAGKEPLHLCESLDLFLSHFADFAEGSALGDAAVLGELDLRQKAGAKTMSGWWA